MTTAEDLAELADNIEHRVKEIVAPASLMFVRGLANEAGIGRAREGLRNAEAGYRAAQEAVRTAQGVERDARESHDETVTEEEWALSERRFVTESNKTWLLTDKGEKDRTLTADERRAWLSSEVRKKPAVALSAKALRVAEEATAAARDALASADRRFSACKADLAAAVALLNTLSKALGGPQ